MGKCVPFYIVSLWVAICRILAQKLNEELPFILFLC
jgi:hypothetical protein